ncbi:unnamed protein product [Owenia fusiformis]|uniref:Uncharacterized protein n=1 Tax=Owenia fusiformis TaxID=6347 RepID=A0A8J1XYI5_OWEFU|nr:unnamed protein product [Owenia fusiformis]
MFQTGRSFRCEMWLHCILLMNLFMISQCKRMAGFGFQLFPSIEGPTSCPGRSRFLAGVPGNDSVIGPCDYIKCVSGQFKRLPCPAGLGTRKKFMQAWAQNQTGDNKYPCVKRTPACNLELGLSDNPVKICGIDLVWIVDISCSISIEDKMTVKRFLKRAVAQLPVRVHFTRIAMFGFSEKIYHVSFLNEYRRQAKLMEAIDGMTLTPTECATYTFSALEAARNVYLSREFGRRKARKAVVIVLTDGFTWPQERKLETLEQARLLHKTGVETYVVGLPNMKRNVSAGKDEWEAIATTPDKIYDLQSFSELQGIMDDISRSACFIL